MIISASRRTDILAFYTPWFLDRLAQGYVLVPNPLNSSQVGKILLTPNVVDCIVFWSKDPAPLLPWLSKLDGIGYSYYFQFTLTPYGAELEPYVRPKTEVVRTFQALSQRVGENRVLWRYDPIVLNAYWDIGRHIRAFTALCRQLAGFTRTCVISFVDCYAKNAAAQKAGLLRPIAPEEMTVLATAFADIARPLGISLQSCCEMLDLSPCGVAPAHCIDGALIEQIIGQPLDIPAAQSQRPACGCAHSLDIGTYDTCLHGCLYCYANRGEEPARRNHALHDPASPFLLTEPKHYRVYPRECVSYRRPADQQQMPLAD